MTRRSSWEPCRTQKTHPDRKCSQHFQALANNLKMSRFPVMAGFIPARGDMARAASSAFDALARARPVGKPGVACAIGQALEGRVAAETEILGARAADRPAASLLAQFEQRAAMCAVDRLVGGRRPSSRARLRRESLPMTALRLTPISPAIWRHDSPAAKHLFSSSTRSSVQVGWLARMWMVPGYEAFAPCFLLASLPSEPLCPKAFSRAPCSRAPCSS